MSYSDCSGVGGTNFVGGIAGCCSKVTISDCHNEGSVGASGNMVGGVAGSASGALSQDATETPVVSIIYGCSNSGSIQAGTNRAGGIAGYTEGSIIACYNSGTISPTTATTMTAGIVGHANNDFTDAGVAEVIGCYNTGEIATTSSNNNNYIIGYAKSSPRSNACYNTATFTASSTGAITAGIQCASIEVLNNAVETMNEAIKATQYSSYIYAKGADVTTNPPTLVANSIE